MKPVLPTTELLQELEKSSAGCHVSIILPLQEQLADHELFHLELKKAIQEAELKLDEHCPGNNASLKDALATWLERNALQPSGKGLGIYTSPGMNVAITFPFNVARRIAAGTSFYLRDLQYTLAYKVPYYTLVLTRQVCRLFRGEFNQVTEIANGHWPVRFVDDYDYNKPAVSVSRSGHTHTKSFEKDKPEMTAIRYRHFCSEIDEQIKNTLETGAPIILAGTSKDLSWFKQVSKRVMLEMAEIHGSFANPKPHVLAYRVWPMAFTSLQDRWKKQASFVAGHTNTTQTATGICDVWQKAIEGKARILLVEKDFHCSAWLKIPEQSLHLSQPVGKSEVLEDAVDNLIELVLQKKGEVLFTDNNALETFGHVALVTRY